MVAAGLTKCVIGSRLLPIHHQTAPLAAGSLSVNKFKSIMSAVAFNSTQAASEVEKLVLLDRHGDKGVITLNRPKALNAINYDMARRLESGLKVWDGDSEIKMVLIKSSSEKAFCAGGDVKFIQQAGPQEGRKFFRQEYTLNNLIGSLSVPYVALIDGIVMGGGCGLSVHGNFRVVTEKALFAMPETAIGLFPDVGASHFLNKLPGSLGTYLGLTGHRLSGRDLFKAGIGTHFVPSDKIKSLEDDIMRLEKPDLLKIDRILQKHQEQWQDEFRKEFSLKPHIGRINSIFGGAKQVEDILAGLEKDNSEWARKHVELLSKMSPTSLKLTFEQLRRGKTMTLPECLKMEYRMSCRVLANTEFYEGVRAMLLDKDNKPRWNPPSLAEVKESDIQAYFEPLASNQEELQL
ncbi:3-hydroxyisobutyryl- hydrolase, mitochondrial [Olea europaea subsp. europaea]|uniref:3-hydroxyisobutyryl-CoA hydrolase n=1 Tax=Olea europaea subsp. europaea TaxID=158383 RepID=A0A8S0REK9_OLEEU|nr:3-hydroxyisobutyryl- hydrolase, mitochondrial [Olea europaea subsp. europaea]